MLPKSTTTGSSIYINPRFRNVHINPHFINKTNASGEAAVPAHNHPPNIHINPRFINAHNVSQMPQSSSIVLADTSVNVTPITPYDNRRIITSNVDDGGGGAGIPVVYANAEPLADTKVHSRTKIINSSRATSTSSKALPSSAILKPAVNTAKSLIRIGSKKLVRAIDREVLTTNKPTESKSITTVRRPVQTKYRIVKEQTAFKIDRRSQLAKQKALLASKTPKINSIRKPCINESLVPQKTVKWLCTRSNNSYTFCASIMWMFINCWIFNKIFFLISRSVKDSSLASVAESRKSATFLNINGILYKTNHRKLEKTQPSKSDKMKQTNYRRVTVRGENFLLDASARHLVRDGTPAAPKAAPSTASSKPIKRIDIGKITFVRNANGTYERTDFHKSRYHLNVAKQRSIQMLTNRLVKSNVPCAIYRKLGKCAAHERGKCKKVHDKKLVDICHRYGMMDCKHEQKKSIDSISI